MAQEFYGKYFSITDPKGVNTVIYRINKTAKEYQEQYPKYTVERLVSSEELNNSGKKKTFFVDYPNLTEGEDLVILSFANDKVVVNMGRLKDDKVRISKLPVPVKFNTIYNEDSFCPIPLAERYGVSFIAFIASKRFVEKEFSSNVSDIDFEMKYLELFNPLSKNIGEILCQC